MKTATVIGLGSMGWGAAVCLLKAGFTTYGVDIRDDVLQKFDHLGGHATPDAGYAVANSDVVFVYLVNAKQVRSVLLEGASDSGGCVACAKAGTIFVLNATMAPKDTIAIAKELHNIGMRVLDAPVSGGAIKANTGDITIMGAGDPTTFDAVDPMFKAISATVYRLGDTVGMGSKMKMINQLLAGVHIVSMGEALALAKKIGLDLNMVYDVMGHSIGGSNAFANRAPHVLANDYEPRSAIDIWLKDLGIVCDEAQQNGFHPLLAELALSLYEEASGAGMGRQDDSSITKWIAHKNGFNMHSEEE